jgi:hypothetical protein
VSLYRFNPSLDGQVLSTSTTYASARDGAGLVANDSNATVQVGQLFSTPNYSCWEGFFAFDTSLIPDAEAITMACLALIINNDNTTTDFTLRCGAYDFGASIDTADFRTAAQLVTLTATRWDSLSSAGGAAAIGMQLIDNTNAPNDINKTGDTRLIAWSSRHEAGTTPTNAENHIYDSVTSANSYEQPLLWVATDGGVCPYLDGWFRSAGVNNTTFTVAGVAMDANDVALAVIFVRANNPTITPPANWNSILKVTNGSLCTLEVFWYRASADESAADRTFTHDAAASSFLGAISIWKRVKREGNPFGTADSGTGATATMTSPTITAQGHSIICRVYGSQDDNSHEYRGTTAVPIFHGLRHLTTAGSDAAYGMTAQEQAAPGAAGTDEMIQAVLGGDNWGAITFDLLPELPNPRFRSTRYLTQAINRASSF